MYGIVAASLGGGGGGSGGWGFPLWVVVVLVRDVWRPRVRLLSFVKSAYWGTGTHSTKQRNINLDCYKQYLS